MTTIEEVNNYAKPRYLLFTIFIIVASGILAVPIGPASIFGGYAILGLSIGGIVLVTGYCIIESIKIAQKSEQQEQTKEEK